MTAVPNPLETLWERLLRGGVSRRHARRYLSELNDHLEDLIAEEPLPAAQARPRALARLGETEALACAMIARPELQAWSSRAPIAAYLLIPSLSLVVCAALAMAGVVGACAWASKTGLPPTSWAGPLAAGAVFFCNAMLSTLLGWAIGVAALRQRSSPLWPCLGILVLAIISASVQLTVVLPSSAGRGEIELLSGFGPSFSSWATYAGRLAFDLTLPMAPYAGLLLWRAARTGQGAMQL